MQMKSLTPKQANEWCRMQGIPMSRFGTPSADGLRGEFQLPSSPTERRLLAETQIAAFAKVSRSLVWITEWGVWPSIDLLEDFLALRTAAGESRDLKEVPAQLVGKSDFGYLSSVVALAVASLWDVHVIGERGRKWLFYSHDEWGCAQGIEIQSAL